MTMQVIMFYFFAGLLVLSSGLVVTIGNPVKSALFLVMAFIASSGLWILLEAEFLAITLVLVYVGAVMVLFLFVVMMLDVDLAQLREGFTRYLPLGGLIAVIIFVEIVLVVGPARFGLEQFPNPMSHGADYSNTRELGLILYTQYVYAFELAAVILVVAIVAAIALTLREKRQTKYIAVEEQLKATRSTRVRLVKMAAEKKK